MTRRMNRDAVFGGLMLALAAAYYVAAAAIPETTLADAVGPQGLPTIYAVILAALSLILLVRSASPQPGARSPQPEARSPHPDAAPLRRAAGLLLIGILYIVVVPWLGYLLSMAALIAGTTYYQGGVVNRHVALVAVSGALFFWLLFVVLLRIQQPPGIWPSLF